MNKKLWILLLTAVVVIGGALLLKNTSIGSQWLWDISDGGKALLPLLAVSAIIDSINPCAFSILLLTIAFLVSIGQLRNKVLLVGGMYVFGIFITYILIGLGILQTLMLFNTPNFMAKFGAILLIALGLINLINEFFPKFPIKLKIPAGAHKTMAQLIEKGSLPTAFLLGALVALCEFPCTGGPYLMVLGLLHDQATYVGGFGYLILYNVIFVLPLAIILLIASNKGLLGKVQAWQQSEKGQMRFISGLVMVALGVFIFFF
jgi:cytochrome c-type biogenesis protein